MGFFLNCHIIVLEINLFFSSKFSQLISSQEQQRLQAKFARPQALNQASQLPGPGPNVATADKKAGNFSHPVVTVSSGSSQNENEKLQKSNNSES